LIPLSKAASRGDQILNANSFESQGFSLVLQEEDLDEISLVNKVKELDENKDKYVAAMEASNQINAIDKIIALIEDAVINRP
ncbi:MAG: UDP-N-acetylglucosamine--N-acetylmuramyl-(pentapeptide) pyrophosphoryl-undecaprenol N-acetylglucosamine transferase, partial [Lachnospiraceae bacterium]|nr:UDP-N-acetylglucosamine--N-acetylmuramyl-(pentapeptide) pyrophosphoryl-undecaprenol N-acetylglucosamine transferase [Lachnospiraceae bacterium]